MKITRAILIKHSGKLCVRVWNGEEPTHKPQIHHPDYENYKNAWEAYSNSYKEYEVHPDWIGKFMLHALNVIPSIDILDEEEESKLAKGIDLPLELIGFKFKEEEMPKWSGIFKTYAILKERVEESEFDLFFNKMLEWVDDDFCKGLFITKFDELKQKYTFKTK